MRSLPNLSPWLKVFAWVYLTLLALWLLGYLLLGDWGGWLTPLNALAFYLFAPLPLALILALALRSRALAGGCLLAGAAAALLWGGLFLPRPSPASAGAPFEPISVMTYNLLGSTSPEAALRTLRQVDADIVCLQELNPQTTAAIRMELSELYPYQWLAPRDGVTGMGVISKLPGTLAQEQLPSYWIGDPQIVDFDLSVARFRLVNFHMLTPGSLDPSVLRQRHTYRLEQARLLLQAVEAGAAPAVLAGDANAAPLNEPYKLLRRGGLQDAWVEAGFGLGHTFPSATGLPGVRWLTRIDHVFVSAEWQVVDAELAPHDGQSDHRGVVMWVRLKP